MTAVVCNCSICSKKAFVHYIVPPDRFELLSGDASLATYRFGTGIAVHRFCRVCGIHPFYTPRSHPDQVDVNLRCLDVGVPEGMVLQAFDGRHWEQNIGSFDPKG